MEKTTPTIIRLPQVIAMTGVPRSTLYRLIKEGKFPKQVKLTEKSIGFYFSQVVQWIETREVAP